MAKYVDNLLPPEVLDAFKYEVAEELGINLVDGYNGQMTARDAGAIGGRIGGGMVRVLLRRAEEELSRGA